ncbi:MAG TPA: hypothetical protein VGN80_01275 [Devosiaceae bacterium]|jgi:hypothetical protein|nr:hypothetical protein [Devosiaceae bacterium]
MKIARLLLPLALLWPSAALADLRQAISDYQAEIDALEAVHHAWLDLEPAEATLAAAFAANGIGFSMQYAEPWGGWLYLDWSSARGVYEKARYRLSEWSYTIGSERFDETAVEQMLAEGMETLRRIDGWMEPWFRDDVKNAVERAYWLDRAHDAGCCGALYYHYRDTMAGTAYADSISPDYNLIGRINVFAVVPEEGGNFAEPRTVALDQLAANADTAVQAGDVAAIRALIEHGAQTLSFHASEETAEVRDLLVLLDERMRYEESTIAELLNQAEAMEPGPLREAVLRAAEDGLRDRLGHLAPLLAAGAAAGDDADAKWVAARLLAEAQRLAMLRDDLDDPFSAPSGTLRLIGGLKAAAGVLEAAGKGGVTSAEAMALINDLGSTFGTPVAPTAPFAAPAGVVATQLGETRKAYLQASVALTAVGDAISGDPEGVMRAITAANALEETLNPRNLVRKLKRGFIDGVVANVPFARTIVGWLGA